MTAVRGTRSCALTVVCALVALVTPTRPDAAEPDAPDQIALEDFEDNAVGAFPADWDAKGWGEIRNKPYKVHEENGNRFLRAEDTGENVVLARSVRWDLKTYRYLSWRWRIRAVPLGADERYESLADSAAGIYLTYRRKLGVLPESIKFVWSTGLPEGAALRRRGIGMPWTIVAGTGTAPTNEWQTFVFDALEAYRETFGGDPVDRPLGLGLLSDANNTGTRAFADYDDILALKHAPSASRIRQFIPAEP